MICKNAPEAVFHPTQKAGQADESALFKPLYRNLQGANADAPCGLNQPVDDAGESAKENAFQDGLESGREDARSLLKASLSPGLTSFVKSYRELAHLEDNVRSRLCAQVSELTCAIAERILGEPPDIEGNDLERTLQNAMADTAKGFRLNIHPNDLRALKAIIADSGMEWTPRMTLLFKANPAVQPGEVRVQDHSVSDGRLLHIASDPVDLSGAAPLDQN
jgi:flagellar biosynthesis/type III secretory pathway protein FliH